MTTSDTTAGPPAIAADVIRPRAGARPASSRIPALVLALASFLMTFDITAVIVALPRIKASLDLDVAGFAWVMDAYSLTFTVFVTAAGVLADRYGRRRVLLFGMSLFTIASMGCGFAGGQAMLLFTRAMQGFSSAFVICGCLALLSERYKEPAIRVKAFALVGTVTGAAMAIGPSGGGLLTEWLGWRWVFLINIPIGLLLLAIIPRVVDESRDPSARKLDVAGIATLTATLLSTIWFLLHGTAIAGYQIPLAIAVAIPAGCFAAFIASQRLQREPMLEMSLFSSASFVGLCLVPLALSVAYWALLVYLPLFLQTGLGRPLEAVSYWMLAATLPMFLLPIAGAPLLLWMGQRTFFAGGLFWVGIGCAVLVQAARTSGLPAALLGMLLCGSGTSVLNSQISAVIMSHAPKERAGTVSAISVILRQGGFASGIAVLGAALAGANAAAPSGSAPAAPFVPLFVIAGATSLVMGVVLAALLRGRPAAH
jgi:MFS family permease